MIPYLQSEGENIKIINKSQIELPIRNKFSPTNCVPHLRLLWSVFVCTKGVASYQIWANWIISFPGLAHGCTKQFINWSNLAYKLPILTEMMNNENIINTSTNHEKSFDECPFRSDYPSQPSQETCKLKTCGQTPTMQLYTTNNSNNMKPLPGGTTTQKIKTKKVQANQSKRHGTGT